MTPYIEKALLEEARRVATASSGTRNDTLFRAAANLYDFVRSGDLDENELLYRLREAAWGNGLDPRETERTISSARQNTNGVREHKAPERAQSIKTENLEPLKLIPTAELADIPSKTMLVNGLLAMDSIAWLVGQPGSYKSFMAMDIALSVASGVQCQGRATTAVPTVYVTGEGRSGLHARVQAWKVGRASADVAWWHPEGIHVLSDYWPMLIQACADKKAGLVILDTQANMTAGMDENSAQEMGQWVQGMQKLQRATGACVLAVHHPNKQTGAMRGSGIMHGAADTILLMERHNEEPLAPCKVSNPKQKDMLQAEPWWVQPTVTLESVVLTECVEPA